MSFKRLTANAEKFIRIACTGNTFSGSFPYGLGRSEMPANTTFTSNSRFKDVIINDSTTYANALIFWFNQYCEEFSIDSNVIAAQVFVESEYKMWEYSNSGDDTKSSAMGISQLYDNEIWDLFFTDNRSIVLLPKDQADYDDHKAAISLNLLGDLTDIRNVIPYLDESNATTNAVALQNRRQLFQNIMDNTEILIKAQCRYMSEIGDRNNNLVSASLFAYATNGYLESKSYNEVISNAAKGNLQVKPGIDYVDKVFKVLGGKYKTKFPGFGREYAYDTTPNDQANRNLSGTVIINRGLHTPPIGYTGEFPTDTVKIIVESLIKFEITNQFLQAGILAVISTEGGFEPKSEITYSNTPNDRLRLVFGTKLSDLSEDQLSLLKVNDSKFFDKVYGSRYGNTNVGDGFKYRGRGFNQITFKDIYKKVGDKIGVDLVASPDEVNKIPTAADAIAAYFADYLATATRIGIPAKYYKINGFDEVDNLVLGTQVALQANVGWKKNLSTSIYPEVFRKQLACVGTLYTIVIT